MATLDERDAKIDALHARICAARAEIGRAIAVNSQTPCLTGSQDVWRQLTEADRILNNVSASLPWRQSTKS